MFKTPRTVLVAPETTTMRSVQEQNPETLWVPPPDSKTASTIPLGCRVEYEVMALIRDVCDSGIFRWRRPQDVVRAAVYWFCQEHLQDYAERYSTFLKRWQMLKAQLTSEAQIADSAKLVKQHAETIKKLVACGREASASELVRSMLALCYEISQQDGEWAEGLLEEIQKDPVVNAFVEQITGVKTDAPRLAEEGR